MSTLEGKILETLLYEPLTVNNLAREIKANKNRVIETYQKMVSQGFLSIREEGNRKRLAVNNQNKNISTIVNRFSTEIELYRKTINNQLEIIKKSKPIFAGFKKIPTRDRTLTLKNGRYQDLGKTVPSHAYTWKIKPKAMKALNYLFKLLNEMYSRSATFTFGEIMFSDKELIKSYQNTAIKIIKETIEKLLADQKDDPTAQIAIKQFIDLNTSIILYHEILKTESKSIKY